MSTYPIPNCIAQIIFGAEYKLWNSHCAELCILLLLPFFLFQQMSSLQLHVTSFFLVPANAFKLCHYLVVRGQVSHLYETTDNVAVLFVVILIYCPISTVTKSVSHTVLCVERYKSDCEWRHFIHTVKGRHILSVAGWIHTLLIHNYSSFFQYGTWVI